MMMMIMTTTMMMIMMMRTTIRRNEQPLPDELVIEILSHLPTKSLARFQCVSKAWTTFISDISTSQRRILAPPVSGFFIKNFYASITAHHHHEHLTKRLVGVPDKLFELKYKVKHSCNGLLLLVRSSLYYVWNPTRFSLYYVWNPTTMEAVALPERPSYPYSYCFLAFNPHQSPHYRVIQFAGNSSGTLIIVGIYFSITGTWLDDQSFTAPVEYPTISLCDWERNSIFHQGALYMLVESDRLLSFDIEKKTFHSIRLPSSGLSTCIGESSGQLHTANMVRHSELHIYKLLEVNNTHKKWLLMHTISTQFLDHHPLTRNHSHVPHGYYLQNIAFHSESKMLYLSLLGKIVSYDPGTGELKEVCKLPHYEAQIPWEHDGRVRWENVFAVIPCLESVNPPGGIFIEPFALESLIGRR